MTEIRVVRCGKNVDLAAVARRAAEADRAYRDMRNSELREYRAKNKEKVSAAQKARRQANRARTAAQRRAAYLKQQDKWRARRRAYYQRVKAAEHGLLLQAASSLAKGVDPATMKARSGQQVTHHLEGAAA